MRLTILSGRIGGVLIIGGCALLPLFVASGALATDGGDTLRTINELSAAACLVLLGFGTAVLSLAGPRPLHDRGVRGGLGMLSVGVLSLVVSTLITIPDGSNDLASGPYVITAAVGLLATAVGWLVTTVSLVRKAGPARVVGRLMLATTLLFPIATILANASSIQVLRSIGDALGFVGLAGVFLGLVGIGVLAITGDRTATSTSNRGPL